MLRESPPPRKVKSELEVKNKKKQKKPTKKTMSKLKNRIEPLKRAELKEDKQVEEGSTVRNFTSPQRTESGKL